MRRWEAKGGNRDLVYEVALWGFPAGVIGGRLYFLATSWNEVPPHWWGPFAFWKGGLGIWGGIPAARLPDCGVLRRRGANVPVFLDAAAPALLVAQAIGRVGNYFNQELFGGPTTLPWGLEISAAHRPAGYMQYATFHPTFLYELIWNLLLACALVWLGHHRRIRAPGLFALYVTGYSFARIGEELLRVDPAHHVFGLRLNFYVASILCLVGSRLVHPDPAGGREELYGRDHAARRRTARRGRSARAHWLRPGLPYEQRTRTGKPPRRSTIIRWSSRTTGARSPARHLAASRLVTAAALGRLEPDRHTVLADVTGPRLAALAHGKSGDREAGDRVKPPPAQRGVGEDAQ